MSSALALQSAMTLVASNDHAAATGGLLSWWRAIAPRAMGLNLAELRAGLASVGERMLDAQTEEDATAVLDAADPMVLRSITEAVRFRGTIRGRLAGALFESDSGPPRGFGTAVQPLVDIGWGYLGAVPVATLLRNAPKAIDFGALDDALVGVIYDPRVPNEYAQALLSARRVTPAIFGLLYSLDRAMPPLVVESVARAFANGARDTLRIVALADVTIDEAVLPLRERFDPEQLTRAEHENAQRLEELLACAPPLNLTRASEAAS